MAKLLVPIEELLGSDGGQVDYVDVIAVVEEVDEMAGFSVCACSNCRCDRIAILSDTKLLWVDSDVAHACFDDGDCAVVVDFEGLTDVEFLFVLLEALD